MKWLAPIVTVGLVLSSVGVPPAEGLVIDFEGFPAGPNASVTVDGVTFSASGGGGAIGTDATPNGTTGILDNHIPHKELRADILGGATSVAVDLGDFDGDPDLLFLEIFNSSNVLLDSTTDLIPPTFTGMVTLSLSNPDIAYAVFGARPPALNGSSVYADNFTCFPCPISDASRVPEPTSLFLACAGLLGIGMMRRFAMP